MVDLEAGPLERQQHPREVQRGAVGEDVALGEGARLGVGMAQPGDRVVEQPAARPEQVGEGARVGVDLHRADVLGHPDRGDRVEALAREVAVVHHADLDLVADARLLGAPPRLLGLRLGEGDADHVGAVLLGAARIAMLPQPQPTSSIRSPGLQRQLARDHVELRLLGLLERLRPARESWRSCRSSTRRGRGRRTRCRRRSDGGRRGRRAPCCGGGRCGTQLGGGARRRRRQAGGAHRGERQGALVGAVERGRLPAVEQPITASMSSTSSSPET